MTEEAQRRAASPRPGRYNALTDVPGVTVGSYERVGDGWLTGTTVVLAPPEGAACGVDVRGAAPGTRETDVLTPGNLVSRVHAIVLTGGSAYGLAAASGVADVLGTAGVGFPVSATPGEVVPIVPAAVIFDLGRGGDFTARPGPDFGTRAVHAANGEAVTQGTSGGGTGALVGGLKGGLGTASAVLADGTTVAALVVLNAAGSAIDPASGQPYGLGLGLPGEFEGVTSPIAAELAALSAAAAEAAGGLNTTIGVVATDAALDTAACRRLAMVAHDGLARAVRPAHRMVDGDTIFGLSTGARSAPLDPYAALGLLDSLLAAGADCFARAIVHAVLRATTIGPHRAYGTLAPSAVSGWSEPQD